MKMLKILLVVMIIVSAFAFTEGCVDKTEKLPDSTSNQTEPVTEPSVKPVGEAISVNTEVNETPAVVLPERKPDTQIIWIQQYSFAPRDPIIYVGDKPVSYTHLRAHETRHDLVCRLL